MALDLPGSFPSSSGPYLNESLFTPKSKSVFMNAARKAIKGLLKAILLQAGGKQTEPTRLVSKFLPGWGVSEGRELTLIQEGD